MAVHEMFPYLRVRDGAAAIRFYTAALGAVESFRLVEPGGRLGHAELKVGSATLMLSEEFPEMGIVGPATTGSCSMDLHLHVDDCDTAIKQAIDAGATLVREPTDAFYGERSGRVRDPFGYEWSIGSSIEEVTPEEMQRRYDALFQS